MRKYLICIIIILVARNSEAEDCYRIEDFSEYTIKVSDTAVYPSSDLLRLSWSCYLDQPINVFLKDLDRLFPNYILSKVFPGHRFFAHEVIVYFGDGVGIILSVRRFKYLNPAHTNPNWNIKLFCKENLSKIELWQNDICLYKSEQGD